CPPAIGRNDSPRPPISRPPPTGPRDPRSPASRGARRRIRPGTSESSLRSSIVDKMRKIEEVGDLAALLSVFGIWEEFDDRNEIYGQAGWESADISAAEVRL